MIRTIFPGLDPGIRVPELHLVLLAAGVVGVDGEAPKLALLEGAEAVEGGFEVVEDDGVGQAFEYKGEFPEWVDPDGEGVFEDRGYGEDVQDDEDEGQEHGGEEDGEAGGDSHDVADGEVVC